MIRRFESLAEIEALPGYVARLNEGKHVLAKALGYYRFKKHIHCALKSCNQPHGHGYVVLTMSDAVVAVGNICGAELFGDEFVTATVALSKEIARQIQQREIEEQLRSLPGFKVRSEKLLKGARGAVWLETAEQSLNRACPTRLLGSLYARSAIRDARIEYVRERTKNDPAPLMGESPKFVVEHLGTFRGLGALRTPSARSIIESQVLAPLTTFSTQTAGSLIDNKPLLKRFSAWFRKVPVELNTAESRLLDAPLFFETSNLRLLSHLATNPRDRELMSRLTWNDVIGAVELGRNHSSSEGAGSAA